MSKYILSLALVLLPSLVLGDWGVGGCSPVGLPLFVPSLSTSAALPSVYKWSQSTKDPNQYHLMKDNYQIGTWFKKENTYWIFDQGTQKHSTSTSVPPIDPPFEKPTPSTPHKCKCGDACKCEVCDGVCQAKVKNYGIDEQQWKEEKEKNKYFSSVEDIVDDSQFLRVVVIGEGRDKVIRDFDVHPSLLPFKGKILVSSYSSDSFLVKDLGYVNTGSPTIYFLDPSGKVLHRQDLYSGPDNLAKALRKKDPNYDPSKDPDLNNSLIPSIDPKIVKFVEDHWIKILAGLAVAYFVFKKKK